MRAQCEIAAWNHPSGKPGLIQDETVIGQRFRRIACGLEYVPACWLRTDYYSTNPTFMNHDRHSPQHIVDNRYVP